MYSGYLALGYAESFYAYGKKVPDSYNIGIGSRKYFNSIGKHFRPKIGAHLGWVNNYYNTAIEDKPYDPIVYGAGVTFGCEIYIKYIILDLESGIVPIFIFNKKNHPYHSTLILPWLFPSIGIGMNLLGFQKKNKKEKKEKEKTIPQFR